MLYCRHRENRSSGVSERHCLALTQEFVPIKRPLRSQVRDMPYLLRVPGNDDTETVEYVKVGILRIQTLSHANDKKLLSLSTHSHGMDIRSTEEHVQSSDLVNRDKTCSTIEPCQILTKTASHSAWRLSCCFFNRALKPIIVGYVCQTKHQAVRCIQHSNRCDCIEPQCHRLLLETHKV